jgi:hypothetical protein
MLICRPSGSPIELPTLAVLAGVNGTLAVDPMGTLIACQGEYVVRGRALDPFQRVTVGRSTEASLPEIES